MAGIDIFSGYIPKFLLILLRASIAISLLPFFGSKNFPAQFKVGLVVAIAFILTPVVELRVTKTEIPFIVMREVLFGITLGFVARSVFFAVDIAGQVISNAMGLSIATVFNPELGQSTEIARLYGLIAMLIFLGMDVHHDLIYAFVRSYEWPTGGPVNTGNLITEVVSIAGRMFVIVLKMSAPVVLAMLITNLLLGLVYKAAPQMNIFFVGYPVYIFTGFLVMLIGIPVFVQMIAGHFSGVKDEMLRVISMVGR